MDCKILKKTLFISILAISLFYTGEVRAKTCTGYYKRVTKLETSCVGTISINGLREKNNFYKFKLGNDIALCMDAGLKMGNGLSYQPDTLNPITSPWIRKAYQYADQNQGSDAARLIAQVIVWFVNRYGEPSTDADKQKLKNAIASAFSSAKNKLTCSGLASFDYSMVFDDIENLPGNVTIYSWSYSGSKSGYQRLISKVSSGEFRKYVDDNEIPINQVSNSNGSVNLSETVKRNDTEEKNFVCTKSCNIETVSDPAVCGESNFYSTSTMGRIYQTATGADCVDTVDDSSPNTLDGVLDGSLSDLEKNGYQVHCFYDLSQEYPGNVSIPVSVGSYLVWPNNNINDIVKKAGLQSYPLSLKYSKICKMDVDKEKLKSDYTTARDDLDNAISAAQNGNQNGVSSENGKEGIRRFKVSSQKIEEKSCSSLKTDTDTAGTNYQNCVNAGSSACEQQHGTAQNCNDDTLSATDKATCETNNAALSSCKRAYEGQGGTCNDDAHGNLWDKWSNYSQQLSACNEIAPKYKTVSNQLKKWKGIVKYSNSFTNQASPSFNAKFNVEYTFTPTSKGQESNIYKKITYNLFEVDKKNNSEISGGTDTEISLSLDPLDDNNTPTKAKFNSDVDNKSEIIAAKVLTKSQTKWYDLNKQAKKIELANLPSINNALVYKESLKSFNSKLMNAENGNKITEIGFVNLPIPNDAKWQSEKLILKLTSLTGVDEEISSKVNDEYVCSYTITGSTSDSCRCPEDSLHPGIGLGNYIKNSNMTCSEAIQKYCYESPEPTPDPDPTPKCPLNTKNSGYDLSSCVNSGGTLVSCISQWCNDDIFGCPNDDPVQSSMSVQFRSCVSVKLNQGLTLEQAKSACNVFCNFKGNKIIYRTISLSNPFPSYDIDNATSKIQIKNPQNKNITMRYPGNNWNSETAIYNKILNNRGVEGDKVYKKTPLYSFKLDAKTIQSIRSYNKQNKYSDFKLNCQKSGAACISTFVHSSTSGRTGTGTCDKTLNKKTFYTCDD